MAARILSKSFSNLFENGLFSSEDDQSFEEMKEYYSEFFQYEHFAQTKITGSKTMETLDEKYTVYIIKVKLPFSEYHIEKRYTQFLELYKKVERKYKNIEIGRTNFPSKRFFGKFTEATIQNRTLLLDSFLNFLVENYQQEQIVEFLEFLEVKKRIEMLTRLPTVKPPVVQVECESSGNDADQVKYFLNIFNRNSRDLCRSFKEFEIYIMGNKKKFSRNEAEKLLFGEGELEGLVHLCGKADCNTESHLTCGAGLSLLSQLLDYECNKDAELFNNIFGSISLRELMWLNFDKHIQGKGFRQCKAAAMKLLNNFLNQNPNIALDQILTDDEVIQEFETWKTSHQTTSIKAESFFRF